jgi:hypothetical protein
MKVKLLVAILFIYSQISLCQSIKGKVLFNNYAISNVEVVNATQKLVATSDSNGDFSIKAKTKDILVFVSKDHELQQITISDQISKNKVLVVELALKAEELSEVLITNTPKITLAASPEVEQIMRDEIEAGRADKSLKPPMIDDLKINKGLNLIRIGGFIAGLLKKEKEDIEKDTPQASFTTIAKNSFEQKFFTETLKLKPNQIDLFLQLCENDPKVKAILQDPNELAVLQFLLLKNAEFKKL